MFYLSVTYGAITLTSTSALYSTLNGVLTTMPKGSIIPISQNTYFTSAPGSMSSFDVCADARNFEEERTLETLGNLKNHDINQYFFDKYGVTYNMTNDEITTNSEIAEAHLISTLKKAGLVDIVTNHSCFQNNSCEKEYLDGIHQYNYEYIMGEQQEYLRKRVPGQTCDIACGRIKQITQFVSSVGDTVEIKTLYNSTNKGLIAGQLHQTLTLKHLNITFPLTDPNVYATDLKVDTNCFCHCPFSASTASCNSLYDGCENEVVCRNNYIGGINDWSCPLNVGYDSSFCCTTRVDDYKKVPTYRIGSPQNVLAVFSYCVAFPEPTANSPPNCVAPNCYRLNCYDVTVTFGNVNQIFTVSSGGTAFAFTCNGPRFNIALEMPLIGDLTGYQGGDRILDMRQWGGLALLANGWNSEYETDVSKPGWLHFHGNTPIYNINSLHNNVGVEVKNCRNDEFVTNITIDSSSTDALLTLDSKIGSMGTHYIDWANQQITLSPTTFPTGFFRFTSDLLGYIEFHTGNLTGFNCTRKAPFTSVNFDCDLYNYVGGSICFVIKDLKGVILGISCGSPSRRRDTTSSLTLGYSLGVLATNGQLCAQGFDQIQCSIVNITSQNFNQFNHSWVTTVTTNFKSSDIEPDFEYDFGDVDTWFHDVESTFQTLGILAVIIIGGIGLITGLVFLGLYFKYIKRWFGNRVEYMRVQRRLKNLDTGEEMEAIPKYKKKNKLVEL